MNLVENQKIYTRKMKKCSFTGISKLDSNLLASSGWAWKKIVLDFEVFSTLEIANHLETIKIRGKILHFPRQKVHIELRLHHPCLTRPVCRKPSQTTR